MAEVRYTWAFAGNSTAGSTFTGEKVDLSGFGLEHSFYVQMSSGAATSATVDIFTGRSTTSPGTSLVGASINFSTSVNKQESIVQISGPFLAVWPVVVISSGATSSTLGVDLVSAGGGGF